MRRSEEHTSELQSQSNLVCRLLLEKKNDARLVHGRADFISANFPHAGAKRYAAMTVYATNVSSTHSKQSTLYRDSGHVFRLLDSLLNGAGGFLQIDDNPFARAPRFSDPMSSITQSIRSDLRYKDTRLRATHINCSQQVCVLVRYSYCYSCPLAIA